MRGKKSTRRKGLLKDKMLERKVIKRKEKERGVNRRFIEVEMVNISGGESKPSGNKRERSRS